MARKPPPPPKCACGHLHGAHQGSDRCLVFLEHAEHDEDNRNHAKCRRCPCPKFRVPSGPGKRHAPRGASSWGMRGTGKVPAKAPWWR